MKISNSFFFKKKFNNNTNDCMKYNFKNLILFNVKKIKNQITT